MPDASYSIPTEDFPWLGDLEYQLSEQYQIWIPKNPGNFYYSEGEVFEKELQQILKTAQDLSLFSPELHQRIAGSEKKRFYLNADRAHLLRPFHSLLQGRVLEVGSGSGVLTRYLAEIGATVLALEGSPRRALMTRRRTDKMTNVTILTDTLGDFAQKAKVEKSNCSPKLKDKNNTKEEKPLITPISFDAITLIGVLEYAPYYFSGDPPALKLLQELYSLLAPEGTLIIGIDNPLALPYFAGILEEHQLRTGATIEGNPLPHTIETFGHHQLKTLLHQAGFTEQDWFAPFPNYKHPRTLISEKGLLAGGNSGNIASFDPASFIIKNTWSNSSKENSLSFCLELAWNHILKNQLGMDMAPSFLVLAKKQPSSLFSSSKKEGGECAPSLIAAHYTQKSDLAYAKESLFWHSPIAPQRPDTPSLETPSLYVKSAPLAPKSYEKRAQIHKGDLFQFRITPERKYIPGETVLLSFLKILKRPHWSQLALQSALERYAHLLEKLFEQKEGNPPKFDRLDHIIPGYFWSALPENIIITPSGEMALAHHEWQLQCPLELGYFFFRSFSNIFHRMGVIAPNKEGLPVHDKAVFIMKSFLLLEKPLTRKTYYYYAAQESALERLTQEGVTIEQIHWKPKNTPSKLEHFKKI